MNEDLLLERWLPIEARLRDVEETYRAERIRKGGHPFPEGERWFEVERDLKATCEIYPSASARTRLRMRSLFSWSYLLPSYLLRMIQVPNHLRGHDAAVKAVRTALAAASLENNKTDSRDTYLSLGGVWLAAKRKGLDPQAYFSTAAEWSSDERRSGVGSMRRFLLEFHESAFFYADVKPRIGSWR